MLSTAAAADRQPRNADEPRQERWEPRCRATVEAARNHASARVARRRASGVGPGACRESPCPSRRATAHPRTRSRRAPITMLDRPVHRNVSSSDASTSVQPRDCRSGPEQILDRHGDGTRGTCPASAAPRPGRRAPGVSISVRRNQVVVEEPPEKVRDQQSPTHQRHPRPQSRAAVRSGSSRCTSWPKTCSRDLLARSDGAARRNRRHHVPRCSTITRAHSFSTMSSACAELYRIGLPLRSPAPAPGDAEPASSWTSEPGIGFVEDENVRIVKERRRDPGAAASCPSNRTGCPDPRRPESNRSSIARSLVSSSAAGISRKRPTSSRYSRSGERVDVRSLGHVPSRR